MALEDSLVHTQLVPYAMTIKILAVILIVGGALVTNNWKEGLVTSTNHSDAVRVRNK